MIRKTAVLVGAAMIVAVFGIIIIVSSGGDRPNDSGGQQPEPAVPGNAGQVVFPVKAAIVHRGNLVSWINSSGYAYPRIENEIKPNTDGKVVQLNAYDGKAVHKDEILFKLDDRELSIELQEAKDQLINAQVDYDLANKGAVDTTGEYEYKVQRDSLHQVYDKAKRKFEEGSISQTVLDRIRRNYDAISVLASINRQDVIANKIGLNRAESEYEDAKLKLSYATMRAPFDGLVANCAIQTGGYVQSGQICMDMVDISKIRINCSVTETDLPNIRVGDEAKAQFVAFSGQTFEGKVVQINPVVDLQKRTATVIVEVPNESGKIKPGMYAVVTIASNSNNDVVIVPKSAVLFRDNRPIVFTVLSDEAQWIYVNLGRANDNYYEIKKGLSVGDTLVIDGNYNLAHEAKVEITGMEKY